MTLLYIHRVRRDPREQWGLGPDRHNAISVDEFSGLLDGTARPVRDWQASLAGAAGEDAGNCVGLTFDDGYKDFISNALPLIERKGVRVLLFVTMNFIDGEVPYEYVVGELLRLRPGIEAAFGPEAEYTASDSIEARYQCLLRWLKPQADSRRRAVIQSVMRAHGISNADLELPQMLDWDDIQELNRHPLVDIGAHCVSHAYLPRQGAVSVWREVSQSKAVLQRRLGGQIRFFAYPYGGHNIKTRFLVRLAGYKYGFGTTRRHRGRLGIPRNDVRAWLDQSA